MSKSGFALSGALKRKPSISKLGLIPVHETCREFIDTSAPMRALMSLSTEALDFSICGQRTNRTPTCTSTQRAKTMPVKMRARLRQAPFEP